MGGSATFVSTANGLQLNRQLNNNLFLLLPGVYAALLFLNFGRSFHGSFLLIILSWFQLLKQYGFGINHGFQMGLMYGQ